MAKKIVKAKKKVGVKRSLKSAELMTLAQHERMAQLTARCAELDKELNDYADSFARFDKALQALTAAWRRTFPDKMDIIPDMSLVAEWAAAQLEQLQDSNAMLQRENQRLKHDQREMEQRLETLVTTAGA